MQDSGGTKEHVNEAAIQWQPRWQPRGRHPVVDVVRQNTARVVLHHEEGDGDEHEGPEGAQPPEGALTALLSAPSSSRPSFRQSSSKGNETPKIIAADANNTGTHQQVSSWNTGGIESIEGSL
eukprot:CAMPEP_0198211010 /NCGR_PEP_ID=MMETSP1445-20131203/22570_1 /TAXON_ID=36898 /ORGANISM="Pyramimonas sp., Strain CCMP2087" /LENGTH=122 /DNA_ID=CAMNT_0043885189 /DNA_START=361 /DNA_END=730 /DNA_ORIENTATION=-